MGNKAATWYLWQPLCSHTDTLAKSKYLKIDTKKANQKIHDLIDISKFNKQEEYQQTFLRSTDFMMLKKKSLTISQTLPPTVQETSKLNKQWEAQLMMVNSIVKSKLNK